MAVSFVMRRYTAEIYRLQQEQPEVKLSDLSEHVDASIQAVSRMVRRLRKGGYLTYEPYRGVRLTREGESIAMPALRRHRLIEVFLVRIMGFDWAEAHDLSDEFELGVNQKLEDRIDDMTGHPTRCPHGEPIPTKQGVMPVVVDTPLTGLEPGAKGLISRVRTHDHDKLRYIAELGLVPGEEIAIIGCAPFRGPLRIRMDSHEQVIGYELASSLWIELDK
jgi:DtxR family Mn-dependent transcriptional regulator